MRCGEVPAHFSRTISNPLSNELASIGRKPAEQVGLSRAERAGGFGKENENDWLQGEIEGAVCWA